MLCDVKILCSIVGTPNDAIATLSLKSLNVEDKVVLMQLQLPASLYQANESSTRIAVVRSAASSLDHPFLLLIR